MTTMSNDISNESVNTDLQVMSAISHVWLYNKQVQSWIDTFPGSAREEEFSAVVHEETDINWCPLVKIRKSLIGRWRDRVLYYGV